METGLSLKLHIVCFKSCRGVFVRRQKPHTAIERISLKTRMLCFFRRRVYIFLVYNSFHRICNHAPRPVLEAAQQFQAAATIGVEDERWRQLPIAIHVHASHEVFKAVEKGRVIGKELRVLKLDGGDHRQSRMIVPEIVVILISLVHEVLALPQAIVRTESRYHGSYLASWI